MNNPSLFKILPGRPTTLGVTREKNGLNFALFSKEAKGVILTLFQHGSTSPLLEIPYDAVLNKTADIWHLFLELDPNILDKEELLYCYKILKENNSSHNLESTPNLLLDPFAKKLLVDQIEGYQLYGVITENDPFDWQNIEKPNIPMKDLIIYELHVKGFTYDSSSQVKNKGTFLGIIEKIPYLKKLGVNAIELMPINEFNEKEYQGVNPENGEKLSNYWGYSPLNFFSIKQLYAVGKSQNDPLIEFKTLVRELHRAGIEIILDVVFNHTGEGDREGPILSFKGINNAVYYILNKDSDYANFSGCGNTLNCNHPIVIDLILEVLHYFVTETKVDGFRFDLASILNRDQNGNPMRISPLLEFISKDPILNNTKLIAEPWDAVGFYQVGSFYPDEMRWSEWNGRYRDTIRKFLRGSKKDPSKFATRISGSQDLYYKRAPYASINFVTSHDGFSLRDLVSYNEKHNLMNGEENRDGNNHNISSNYGVEGETTDPEISLIRERQMRNFHFVLMISQGVPLLFMGDEYGHTKKGNNNSWCQDNQINWFQWDLLERNKDFYRFYQKMIEFRKNHAAFRRGSFLTHEDVMWHGIRPFEPNFGEESSFLAFTLRGEGPQESYYIAINAKAEEVEVFLPPPPSGTNWQVIVNTGNETPFDFNDIDAQKLADFVVKKESIKMKGRSCLLLQSY